MASYPGTGAVYASTRRAPGFGVLNLGFERKFLMFNFRDDLGIGLRPLLFAFQFLVQSGGRLNSTSAQLYPVIWTPSGFRPQGVMQER